MTPGHRPLMHPIHVDPSLTGPRWLAHLGEAQDFTVLHTIPQPAEDRRAMVSVLRGRGSAERLRYSPLQTLVTWEVSAGLAEGDPGEGAGSRPQHNLLLTPLTAVHVVTCRRGAKARGQQAQKMGTERANMNYV